MAMKRKVNFYTVGVVWGTPAFLFLTVLFICGAIAGGFTGLLGKSSDTVTRLADYLVLNAQNGAPVLSQVTSAMVSAVAWPVACLAAGLLTPSSLFIGGAVAVRGFSLSFTVAAMVSKLGMRGLLVSLAATGASAVVTAPCLLVIASSAFLATVDAPKGQRRGYLYALGRYRGALAICFALSVAAATLRAIIAPFILSGLG